ncbi:MAG: D-tyrosyl-tRNA(Tyr) deacylase [Candidatus Zixiibacteriota bacterium]|nr:MAG: D-tyrosyl-tRNA(Tyr) deacylase [candidate division Zixibacteria bacterium]
MKVVLQRTNGVEVWINGKLFSSTGNGLLLLHGTRSGDSENGCTYLADKIVNLRIFEDEAGKMNRSIRDIGGEIMIVSQFTLCANTSKGRRPSFNTAMEPAEAERLYDYFVKLVKDYGLTVKTGSFGARMDVKFTNCGPVTFILEHDS